MDFKIFDDRNSSKAGDIQSVKQIMKIKELIAVVPGPQKAQAIAACFNGEISPMAPASILRNHAHATVYLDKESATLLRSGGHSRVITGLKMGHPTVP